MVTIMQITSNTQAQTYNYKAGRLVVQKRKVRVCKSPLIINGIPTQAIADTGAPTTVISEKLYESMLMSVTGPKDIHQTYLLNAGVGAKRKAKHRLTVTFQIGSKSLNWEVHIALIRDCSTRAGFNEGS